MSTRTSFVVRGTLPDAQPMSHDRTCVTELRDDVHKTSAVRGGVEKLENFADEQYIKCSPPTPLVLFISTQNYAIISTI